MSSPESKPFTSPYDIRLALSAFRRSAKEGVSLETLKEWALRERNLRIREVVLEELEKMKQKG